MEVTEDTREINRRQRGMSPLRVNLSAGTPQRFAIAGDYIHIQTAPGDDLSVSFDDSEPVPMSQGLGFRRYYTQLVFTSTAGQAIVALAGFGSVADSRSTLTIQPGNDVNNGGDVSCVAQAATQLLAADSGRLYALIKNVSDNTITVRIGDATVDDSSGCPLEPGETLPVPTTSALYAYNDHATDAVTINAASVRRL